MEILREVGGAGRFMRPHSVYPIFVVRRRPRLGKARHPVQGVPTISRCSVNQTVAEDICRNRRPSDGGRSVQIVASRISPSDCGGAKRNPEALTFRLITICLWDMKEWSVMTGE